MSDNNEKTPLELAKEEIEKLEKQMDKCVSDNVDLRKRVEEIYDQRKRNFGSISSIYYDFFNTHSEKIIVPIVDPPENFPVFLPSGYEISCNTSFDDDDTVHSEFFITNRGDQYTVDPVHHTIQTVRFFSQLILIKQIKDVI